MQTKRKSLLTGIGSVVDLYPIKRTRQVRADKGAALYWSRVGNYLQFAIGTYDGEQKKRK